jgi:hypothetical protein
MPDIAPHTPGPWKLHGIRGGYLVEAKGLRVVRGQGGVKTLADGTLIVAAPEMLAMLRKIWCNLQGLGSLDYSILREIEALIARADLTVGQRLIDLE